MGQGMAARVPGMSLRSRPAVTLTVAKRKGTNAIQIADKVIDKVNLLKGKLIPAMSR